MTIRNRCEYDKVAKEVKYAIRRAKAKMERELAFSGDDNGKKFRDYIKSKTKTRPKIGPLVDSNGNAVTDPRKMSGILNDYFATVFTQEDISSIPTKNLETDEKLSSFEVYEREIVDKIYQLKRNSAPGPDGIGPVVLQETAKIIAYPLKIIFETTLRERKCPDEWKTARVVPIYKKDPKESQRITDLFH